MVDLTQRWHEDARVRDAPHAREQIADGRVVLRADGRGGEQILTLDGVPKETAAHFLQLAQHLDTFTLDAVRATQHRVGLVDRHLTQPA